MSKLLIPQNVFQQIIAFVADIPDGLETGVSLFGTCLEKSPNRLRGRAKPSRKAAGQEFQYVVLTVAGPGRKATHEAGHYSGDENHSNQIYEALQSALPGIRWLGELHVHPTGIIWLSGGDLRTVRQILTGTDDTFHPGEFIAGVMQRKKGTVDIYPFHFTPECLKGRAMELLIVNSNAPQVQQARQKGVQDDRPSVCAQSAGSRTTLPQTHSHHWLRKWWERHRSHVRTSGHRPLHPR